LMDSKVCLVTGASRGIGYAIAEAFHSAGAKVYGIGRTSCNAVVAEWDYMSCDVTRLEERQRVLRKINNDGFTLSVLVNAAGITQSNAHVNAIANFNKILETNLVAAYAWCIEALPQMRLVAGGSIINITSIGSVLGFPGNPSYGTSKGGLRMLTKALANDLGVDNVRVNNIAPGYIKTDMTKSSFEDYDMNQIRRQRMLIDRWGEVDDLCGAAIFLASDASSYVTGLDLFVDGGWTAKGL